ncbi:follicle-stimulating hormone receptor [Pseudoliparis swirei]|uniref:follicle-stimulating hormone receptor n=1 Tax=Pseudoliparis swirei TaxID=2059687 RepID=UPI0024BEE1C8|nr:follicle-stimulating hormone receptor [Pseudoliparis swirei]
MMAMVLIALLSVGMKTAAAAAGDTEMDINPGVENDLCYKMRFEDTEIPSNISNDTQCLEVVQTQITRISHGAFSSLQHLRDLFISENFALTSIGAFAFSDLPELENIEIAKSKHLRHIHQDAFKNLVKLQRLTISNTGLTAFPNLSKIHSTSGTFIFLLKENNHIKEVPANAFRGLCTQTISQIELTRNGIEEVASDAFNGIKMKKLFLKGNKQLSRINANAFVGSSQLVVLDISETALSSLPEEDILSGLKRLIAQSAFNLKKLPPPQRFTKLLQAELTYSWNRMCSRPGAGEDLHFQKDYCDNSSTITCSPTPDDFNPCEDIMSAVPLRVLIWIISVLALLGNTAVLLVLLGSRSKLTVPRFLMCHLAFSDLCMGIYLVVIATVDMLTRGQYYNNALDWQTGVGCSIAGFFTVFSSELSVFTLTAITLERWYTIRHALRLDRKLCLRHACIAMTVGWIISSIAALLPTVGVSSYSKVSICLPMDVESLKSQVYVVFFLLLNILAFICVCGCYLSIYLTVRNPSSAPAHADTRVAQRMAILIFTDFVCMAPISFFAISAAIKLPLISVSDSKLLLVLFYPINSCSNPFLYAFFTRTFRRDFFLLAARFGLFKTRAQIYRTESSSCQ